MSDYMIADKDDEWKEEMLRNILLGATFQAARMDSYHAAMLAIYETILKATPESALEGKKMAKLYFKSHASEFPLELPSEADFENMAKVASAAIFVTRVVEVAEEGLIRIREMADEFEEKTSQFQEDNS